MLGPTAEGGRITPENNEMTLKVSLPQMTSRMTILGEKDVSEISQSADPPGRLGFEGKKEETPRSSDGVVDNRSLKRSASVETICSETCDGDKTLEKLFSEKFCISDTTQTLFIPKKGSYTESSGADSRTPSIVSSKRINRAWPRARYAMQQKCFVTLSTAAVTLGTSAVLVYLQDKTKFVAFFTTRPKYVTIPVVALALLVAIIQIFCTIRQFKNTEECQTREKNADKVLDEIFKHQPNDKVIKSVRLEYGNDTHSSFVLNTWKSKNGFVKIDEKVVSRTNKTKSVINNRPIFTALLTGLVATDIVLVSGLLAMGGVSNAHKFYQNLLNHNLGLSLLIGSGMLTLLAVYLGVHYYNKTNCTNLIYSLEEINAENVNKKLIEEIKRERTNVLEKNHSKDAKCSSLTLQQVVIQSHNYPDVVYDVSR